MSRDGFERVLIPTDGSDTAAAAVDRGLSLAAAYGASVTFLFVADVYAMSTVPESREAREHGREVVDALVERAADEGVEAEGTVRTGFPHEEVLEAASDIGADLVVMSSHGRSGVERFLSGSVTERVVRLSEVPVLTVHAGGTDAAYDRVLVPTDGSDTAARATEVGVGVAREFGAAVDVLSVVETVGVGFDVRSEQHREERQGAARRIVDDAVERARAAGVEAEGSVAFGTPHREILAFAEEAGTDLVVMGTHGRTGLDRYLLGSVAERTLRLAHVPVLTVPLPEADADADEGATGASVGDADEGETGGEP